MQFRVPALFGSLRGWTTANAWRDLAAGVTLAAITIPEQMATARLAGLEPQIGFYAFIGATLGFAALGASRLLTAGADSTITPIFAGALAAMAASGSGSLGAAAVALAFLVGAMLIVAGLLRLGWIANLLSIPVVTGFLVGIAVHIAVSQLPALLGIDGDGSDFYRRIETIARNLPSLNPFSAAIGLGVLAIMIASERINGRIPGALIGVMLATIIVQVFDLESRGVAVLGPLPGGLPHFALPSLDDMWQLLPLALIVSLVVMIQTAAVSQSFPDPDGRSPAIDQDYIGVGAGNLAAGVLGALPVDASPPRTAVVAAAGGSSQMSALLAAGAVLLLVVFGGTLLAHIPQAALAGILMFVAQRLIHTDTIARIAREAPIEGLLGLATTAAIVVLPIQIGVTFGIGLSLLHGVWMTTQTRPVEMRRLPGTTVWWPPSKTDRGECVGGVAVIAFQAPLLFANAETFKRAMIERIDGYDTRPAVVVLEASSIADIDYTAAEALSEVIRHCRRTGIAFAIARLESIRAQDALDRFGTLDALGPDRLFHSVEDAVQALAPEQRSQARDRA